MKTYKLGNKAKCIIRAYAPGVYGDETINYANQPYTILKDVSASFNFSNYEHAATNHLGQQLLNYNVDFLDTIYISNVKLTEKILKLIYCKSEDKLCAFSENYTSNENKEIFLNANYNTLYQVFIYNVEGQLEAKYDKYDAAQNEYVLKVDNANSSYIICYSIYRAAVDLNNLNNYNVTLDFEFKGNQDNNTTTYWLHIDRCVLKPSKSIMLDGESNSTSIECDVINDNTTNNYLIVL